MLCVRLDLVYAKQHIHCAMGTSVLLDTCYRFLFHKESVAYRQYQQLVEQFKAEIEMVEGKREDNFYKPEDAYEQDSIEDEYIEKRGNSDNGGKRKRKSRWGDKATVAPLRTVQPNVISPNSGKVIFPFLGDVL